ncbi:MAG: DUF6320 domain-containing protein [Lachnospiraceae bacterium]|nr:zinc ribbon domain-containing protein [Lachnospiraceae bacterium]MEE3378849.1 DUF6320 domain-containing protein [Lachnospiraceae bacterium]MEE3432255.1 DUF6320 domain-containing protein [Lachnospiraceae bacterium]
MRYCKNCGIRILDEAEICPMCSSVLSKVDLDDWPDTFKDPYPDVMKKRKHLSLVMRLVTFLVLAACMFSIFANYNFSPSFPWSLIVSLASVYLLWIVFLIYREAGYLTKIFAIVLGGVALVVVIDLTTGARGWSWNYVLPGAMLFVDLAFLILMIINSRNWQGYMILQILMILVALVPLVLILKGIVTHPIVSELAILSALLLFLGTLILGGRTARTELQRRFRI